MKNNLFIIGGIIAFAGVAYYVYKKYIAEDDSVGLPTDTKVSKNLDNKLVETPTPNTITPKLNDIYSRGLQDAKTYIFRSENYKKLVPTSQEKLRGLLENLNKEAILKESSEKNLSVDRVIMNIISSRWTNSEGRGTPIMDYFGFNG